MTLYKLVFYPNLSKGGVTSVLRGRAKTEPDTIYDAIFTQDRGGAAAFDDVPNINSRVIIPSRVPKYLEYVTTNRDYSEISVLSHPETANLLSAMDRNAVQYEFHSSNMQIIEKELQTLESDRIARFVAPSATMIEKIKKLLPKRLWARTAVVPNLVDPETFSEAGPADFFRYSGFDADDLTIPLVWVGRFDQGKGYAAFARVLGALPDQYVGHVVVSLEDDPARADRFLAECAGAGVANRVRLYLNLPAAQMANLYRSARDAGGYLVSTSLMESFGYAVAEATSCGLRVAAFDLPVWDLFESSGLLSRVPMGDLQALKLAIAPDQGA